MSGLSISVPDNCWPNANELLLLAAGLSPPATALEAWDSWRGAAVRPMSVGQQRLLPFAYWNLRGVAPTDVWWHFAEAEFRRARYRNLILFDDLGPALGAFRRVGIPCLLLKGAALSSAHYEDPGLRPMADVDILVRPGDVEPVTRLLAEHGYHPAFPAHVAPRSWGHSTPFLRDGSSPVDLHWRSLMGDLDDEGLWDDAVEARLGQADVRIPSAADLLLNACVRGLQWDWDAPQRWVLDAMAILRSSSGINWVRVVERAKKTRRVSVLRDALEFLESGFGAPVPRDVTAALSSARVPIGETLAAEGARTRPELRGPLALFAMRLDEHRRLSELGLVGDGFQGLVEVWRHAWSLDSVWELPAQAARRGARRSVQLLRRRLGGRTAPL